MNGAGTHPRSATTPATCKAAHLADCTAPDLRHVRATYDLLSCGMPDQPPALESVRALVRSVIQYAPEELRALLLAQAERLEYVGGPITMMELRVTGDCAAARGVKGPLPGGPSPLARTTKPSDSYSFGSTTLVTLTAWSTGGLPTTCRRSCQVQARCVPSPGSQGSAHRHERGSRQMRTVGAHAV